jgi:hypothetical protein
MTQASLELVAAEYEAYDALEQATDADLFAFEWPDLHWYANAALKARNELATAGGLA